MKNKKIVVEYVPKQVFQNQLNRWTSEWSKVIESISNSQDKNLWQGKMMIIQYVSAYLVECGDGEEQGDCSLSKLVNKLYDLELKVQVEQQLAVKQRQNEKIVFNQGLLDGIRQMRLFVLALKYPMVSTRN